MPTERVSKGFKDISMTFQSNPLNDDLIGLKDANAIARSVRNIVFTIPGEKFFNQSFGSRITESVFENIDDINAAVIADEIRESITLYEPRVDLKDVIARPNFETHNFDVLIKYNVVGVSIPSQELQFVLQSSR